MEQVKNMEKAEKLALDILHLARNTLLVNLRFLDVALSRFQYVRYDRSTLLTDGQHLLYNPYHVLRSYKAESEVPVRDYMHIVLHCIYRHMFVDPSIDQAIWDLACDMAVENTITDLGLSAAASKREEQQRGVLGDVQREAQILTAEKIYRYYRDAGLTHTQAEKLRKQFCADDHEIWYMTAGERQRTFGFGSKHDGMPNRGAPDSDAEGSDQETGSPQMGDDHDGEHEARSSQMGPRDDDPMAVEKDWKKISEQIQEDLATFSKGRGDRAASLVQNLRALNRERYNYETFLRKFAVLGEVMKVDPNEFDYIFYTYGLQLYGNMPLIEPLEYREDKRIREFVIAIDTSGSVAGGLVQTFLQKTYNILKSTESFFSKINLHIIQCDADIQEDAKITSQDEFDAYLKTVKLHGFGGTDFRPVFRYVDTMIQNHEFRNLRGLLYFTDGYGDFPAQKPDYDTAFVFIDDGYSDPEVPPWAIKLILPREF